MAGCSTTMARFDADWSRNADAPLAAPLNVTAQEALHRARIDGDAWLSRLIAATQAGDELAGRCVVQAVLGRLSGIAARDVRSYPLGRRPRAIATNLVLDARKDALRELRPLALVEAVQPRRHAMAARMLEDAVRIGIIDSSIGEVMSSVYVLGLSGEAAAQRHGVTPTTVRWRCSAGMRRLARARELLV